MDRTMQEFRQRRYYVNHIIRGLLQVVNNKDQGKAISRDFLNPKFAIDKSSDYIIQKRE